MSHFSDLVTLRSFYLWKITDKEHTNVKVIFKVNGEISFCKFNI